MNDVASRRNARSTRIADNTSRARSPTHGSTTRPYSPLARVVDRLMAVAEPDHGRETGPEPADRGTPPGLRVGVARRRSVPRAGRSGDDHSGRQPPCGGGDDQDQRICGRGRSACRCRACKSSGKRVHLEPGERRNPSAVSPARTPTWVSTAGCRTRRAMAVASPRRTDHPEARPIESGLVPERCRRDRRIGRDQEEGDTRLLVTRARLAA